MAIFRKRFPPSRDIVLVFAACVFPVFSWSILVFMKKLPHWLLFFKAWDMVGVFAYTQVFALLESMVSLSALVLLSALLPARLFRDRFVAVGSMAVLLTAGWIIADRVKPVDSLSVLPLYLGSFGVCYALITLIKRLEAMLFGFTERLTVLLYLYVPVAFLSVVIVVLRNLRIS